MVRDGIDLSPADFYHRLRLGGLHPTTAAPSAGDFLAAFERLRNDGAEAIVAVLLGSQLSATFEAAWQAAQLFNGPPVRLVDSRSVSMGTGFAVLAAARAIARGACLDEVVAAAEAVRDRTQVRFTLETLEYLRRGGRIGAAAAWVGNMLQLVPILAITEAGIIPVTRVRTKSRAVRMMVEEVVTATAGRPTIAAVVHAEAHDEAEQLAAQLQARCKCNELYITGLTPVLGAHGGPGTLGIGWYHADEPLISTNFFS